MFAFGLLAIIVTAIAIDAPSSIPPVGSLSVIPSSVNASSKAGLAWPNGNSDNYKQYTSTGKVSWYYTWSPNAISADIEFVPMLWGQDQVQAFSSSINQSIVQNDVSAVLGMNEPEQAGQSNLTIAEGVEMWMTYIQPLNSQGLRLGTPASSSAPSGKTWIQDWLSACNGGCTPDFVAIHWYDVNATQFQLYLEDFHNTFNLPIWVTEWACQNYNNGPQCTQQGVFDFLNQTQSFMDSTPWVERYAWFGVMENLEGVNSDNAMMDPNGKITPLGEQYIMIEQNGSSLQLSSAVRRCTDFSVPVIVSFISLLAGFL